MKYENTESTKCCILVFAMYVTYYFIHFEFISASADQYEFKKVFYSRQIILVSILLRRAITNQIL